MEAQTITTNGTGSTPAGAPPGSRIIPVSGHHATALRALVSELKQVQDSLAWLADQIARATQTDITGLKCAGVQNENGQINLVYVPDEVGGR